ncbi:MAG TPA: pentapeptide repeat-containing protein, partial [Ktedonobacterales bacterium]
SDEMSSPEGRSGADLRGVDLSGAALSGARLEHAALGGASLVGADLSGASLEAVDFTGGNQIEMSLGIAEFLPTLGDEVALEMTLTGADLNEANLRGAQLEKAKFNGANLSQADLSDAVLWQAELRGAALWHATLKGASLLGADMSGAYLNDADLTGAFVRGGKLQGADLREAILEGLDLRGVDLRGADLRGARMDPRTLLASVAIDGETRLADVGWNEAPLTRVDWRQLRGLGDERVARRGRTPKRKRKTRATRLLEYQAAVRANRQVATALRNQGLNEQADRFAYRARLLQRRVLWRERRWGAALGSLFLDLLAGYGYRPWRSFVAYALVLMGFAAIYFALGQSLPEPLTPDGAFIFSMTSFHGRGFFPGGLDLAHPITRLAALEAFVGLIIEVSFIATFTQRFFAR